jgi:hypothetical protein
MLILKNIDAALDEGGLTKPGDNSEIDWVLSCSLL